jgi:hypothetical protein
MSVPGGWWRRVLITFALFFLPMVAWSLASPRYAAPDELDHARKAAGVVRGQVFGDHPTVCDTQTVCGPGWGEVTIPASFSQGDPQCFAFHSDVTADCQRFTAVSGTMRLTERARLYPPLYYGVVGLPTLAVTSTQVLYLMRLVSAAWCALALTAAAMVVRCRARPHRYGLALLAAATPMVIYLSGTVNPNGVEVATGVLFWLAGLAVFDPDPGADPRGGAGTARVDGRVLALAVAAASLLVVIRPLSWLWAGLIGVALVVLVGRRRVLELWRTRQGKIAAAVVAAVCVLQAAYLAATGLLGVDDPDKKAGEPTIEAIRISAGKMWGLVQQMIGTFGYLDSPSPALTIGVWLAVLGFLVLAALAVARRRGAWVLGGLTAGVVVVPWVLEVREAPAVGFLWQGRYTLPLAVGVPLLAGHLLAGSALGRRLLDRRVVVVAAAGLGLAQLLAFYFNLRRYMVGTQGPVLIIHADWHPPVPAIGLVVLAVVSTAGLVAWLVGTDRRWSLYGPPPSELAADEVDEVAPAAAGRSGPRSLVETAG